MSNEESFEKIPVESKKRNFEIGRLTVCSETGQPVHHIIDATGKQIWLRSDNTICEKIVTLREFFEKKYQKPFVESEWKFTIKDVTHLEGIKPTDEVVPLNTI